MARSTKMPKALENVTGGKGERMEGDLFVRRN